MAIARSAADVQARTEDIRKLLDRHRVLTTLATRQATSKRDLLEQMQRRENLAALQKHVRGVHPADLAAILESLPPDDRLLVWRQLPRRDAGLTLVELSADLRTRIVDALERPELVEALAELDGTPSARVRICPTRRIDCSWSTRGTCSGAACRSTSCSDPGPTPV